MGELIEAMRLHAGLEQDQLAERIGVSPRTLERLEKNIGKTTIKRAVARKIVEVTGVTRRRYGYILANTASKHLGVRLAVMPSNALVPSHYVLDALRLFPEHGYKLDEEEQESIARVLDNLRCHDAQAERLSDDVAKDIIRRINNARIKLGEDPSKDSED